MKKKMMLTTLGVLLMAVGSPAIAWHQDSGTLGGMYMSGTSQTPWTTVKALMADKDGNVRIEFMDSSSSYCSGTSTFVQLQGTNPDATKQLMAMAIFAKTLGTRLYVLIQTVNN